MKRLLLRTIRLYQRHVSPRKGYCCAYRQYTGGASCSSLGYRAIRRHGALRGLAVLRLRFARCAQARDALRERPRLPARLRGDCDLGVCDIGGCDLPDVGHCDALKLKNCPDVSLCDSSCCDIWSRSKEPRSERKLPRRRAKREQPSP